MKTKLSKVLGVGLALVLVLGLLSVFAPVKEAQAALGEQTWLAQTLPTSGAGGYWKMGAGTDVTEYAIANNGVLMFAINGNANLNAAATILKSPGAGMFWVGLPAITGAAALPVTNIAVAPDNPNVIAVSGGSNVAAVRDQVWISTDAGATWAQLPNPNIGAAAINQRIMDLKIGPARTGTIYGRDYVIATSDNRTNNVAEGSLQILGETATWTNILAPGTADFTSCEISPNFVGDRIVIGVGSTAALTNLYTYNCTNYGVTPPAVQHVAIRIDTAANNIQDYGGAAAAATDILISDIALPSNYDVTMPGMERAFVTIASNTAADSMILRCDGILAAQALMTYNGVQAHNRSVAYAGTVTAGRLFVGNYAFSTAITTGVWYTDDAQTNLPVWYPSFKPPTGSTGLAYVRCSPNYDANSTVYAGTTGANESAFSASTDAGVTYNQLSLIDSGAGILNVVVIDAIKLTPDAGTLFMATDDGAELSLWQTATPPDPYGWMRIYCFTGAAGVLDLNPDWATAPEIYFAETPTVASRFYASVDGGAIFSAYTAPQIGVAITSAGLAVEKSKTLYLAIGGNVYTSTNGGQVWSPPASASIAGVAPTVAAPGDGVVLVGDFGSCSYSLDGGTSFIPLTITGLPGQSLLIMADEDYATNSIAYVGDTTGATGVYRFTIGTSALWTSLANPTAANVVDMAMNNGTMYAASLAACDRTLDPAVDPGTMSWGILDSPAGTLAAVNLFTAEENKAYAADGATPAMWGYDDQMATSTTTISQPAAGAVVPVDPVNGRGLNTTIAWSGMGTGTGLCTNYDVYIYDTSAPTAGTTYGRVIVAGAVVADASVAVAPPFRPAPSTDTATLGFVLLGGHEYGIMVRASAQVSNVNVAGDRGQYSNWSAPVVITVEPSTGAISPTSAGPQLQSPQPGAQNVNPDCSFSWAPMAGVTAYNFILAKDAALTDVVASDTVSGTAFGPVTLEPDTDYYYAVQASAPTTSVQSIGAFHTSLQVWTDPATGLTYSTRAELEAAIAARAPTTPLYIWIVIAVGAILVIAVIWLIFTTRRA